MTGYIFQRFWHRERCGLGAFFLAKFSGNYGASGKSFHSASSPIPGFWVQPLIKHTIALFWRGWDGGGQFAVREPITHQLHKRSLYSVLPALSFSPTLCLQCPENNSTCACVCSYVQDGVVHNSALVVRTGICVSVHVCVLIFVCTCLCLRSNACVFSSVSACAYLFV